MHRDVTDSQSCVELGKELLPPPLHQDWNKIPNVIDVQLDELRFVCINPESLSQLNGYVAVSTAELCHLQLAAYRLNRFEFRAHFFPSGVNPAKLRRVWNVFV